MKLSKILNLACRQAGLKSIIFTSFLLRLFVAWFQYSGDLGNHLAWGQFILHSPMGLFSHDFTPVSVPNYPPLAMFIFAVCLWTYQSLTAAIIWLNGISPLFPSSLVPLFQDSHMPMLFMKLPALLADLVIGVIILKRSRILGLLYLFCPATIYLSSVWGQIEPLTGLLVLLSFLSPSVIAGVLLFTLAALTKQTALWIAPVFLVFTLRRSVSRSLLAALLALIIFVLSYQPFLSTPSLLSPFTIFLSTLQGSSQVIADQAWNLWSFLVPATSPDSTPIFGIPIRSLSITSLFIAYICVLLYQFKVTKKTPFPALFLISLAAFFLQTRVHERHLYPALLFSLFLPLPKKIIIPLYILISVFFMANLYWSLRLPFI